MSMTTWLVIGLVVAGGAVAFLSTEEVPSEPGPAAAVGPTALNRTQAQAPAAQQGDAPLRAEDARIDKRARELLEGIAKAEAAGSAEREVLVAALRKEAWDSPAARRFAYMEGRRALVKAGEGEGRAAIVEKDRARRLLSRAVYLPEMFRADGTSSDERTRVIDEIQRLNRQVMRYGPGLEGVTSTYKVEAGVVPVQVVSREKLPMGSNAILYWNLGGTLDPTRVRADQVLLLPQEELTLHVHQRWRRLGLFLGDWFVKEFRVGIGKEETPTPLGTFAVHSRQRNPDWYPAGGKMIPYGDPRNELGSAWIAIVSPEWPLSSGYGIHGTNKPDTLGTRCSNGCVRLANDEASELYDWVRTASAGGVATKVIIR